MTRLATLAALVVILGAYGQADAQASNVSKLFPACMPHLVHTSRRLTTRQPYLGRRPWPHIATCIAVVTVGLTGRSSLCSTFQPGGR